jgi:Uncharacterized conserved protein
MKDYNKSILEYSDVRDAANYAREEGFKYGKEEGVREGKKEGEEKAVEKGRKEREIEIAKNFLKQGVSTEMIEQCTGLTAKEIEALK